MTTTTRPRIRVRPPAPIRSDATGAGTPSDLVPDAAERAAGGTVAPAVASPEHAQPVSAANDPGAAADPVAAQNPEHHRAGAARTDPTSPDGRGYTVGYGKPPKEHQFRKGQSGNLKGRPKGTPNLRTAFDETLGERIIYSEEGKRKRAPATILIAKRVRNKALQGDDKAIAILAKYSSMLGREAGAEAESDADNDQIGEIDQAALEILYQRWLQSREDGRPRMEDPPSPTAASDEEEVS